MATIQDAIKRLTYVFTSDGADKVAADLNKVGDATAAAAAASTTTATASLSLENAFGRLETRFVSTIKAQQDYEKVQNTVNAAVAQNPALQDRANVVLEAAKAKYDAASGSAGAFAAALDAGRGAALGYAAGIGPIGAVLGSFGPWGVAAAAGIGLVSAAFDYMNTNAAKFGEASIQINKVSQATGLTTTEVRGLSEAAEKAGVSGDDISSSFEKLTANLATARDGHNALFTSLEKVNGGLAVDVALAKDGITAYDLIAKAVATSGDAFTKAAIAKAAFNKGGVQDIPVLQATFDAGGLAAYSEEVQKTTGITEQLTESTRLLKSQIDSANKTTANIYASIYSDDVLTRQAKFAQVQLQIAQSLQASVNNARAGDASAQSKGFYGSTLGVGAPATDEFGTAFPVVTPHSTAATPSSGAPVSSTGNSQIAAQATATNQLTTATSALAGAQSRAATAQAALDTATASGTASTGQLTTATSALAEAHSRAAMAQAALDTATASGTTSISQLTTARQSAGNALELLSNAEKNNITALGGAASGAEILQQKTDALTAALDQGTISTDTYNRALHGDTNNQVAALEDQRAIIEAIGASQK
jgi:hypothetical protein